MGISEQELANIEHCIAQYRGDADSGSHERWEALQVTLAGHVCQRLLNEVRSLRASSGPGPEMDEQGLAAIETKLLRAMDGPTRALIAEVQRLRSIETAAARVNDVWHGHDENAKFSAWRALNIALNEPRPDTPLPTRRVALRKMVEDAEAQGLYDQPEVSAG